MRQGYGSMRRFAGIAIGLKMRRVFSSEISSEI
jgi:hypothetical protein